MPASAAALRPRRSLRNYLLEQLPQLIRHQPLNDRNHDRQPTEPNEMASKARGHFPNEIAALECVYMAIMSLEPTGKGQARWTMRWKTALNAFDISFDGRLSAARQ
ncbi:hypothetical protein SCANM63S_03591 [Streptomyces canarius]